MQFTAWGLFGEHNADECIVENRFAWIKAEGIFFGFYLKENLGIILYKTRRLLQQILDFLAKRGELWI